MTCSPAPRSAPLLALWSASSPKTATEGLRPPLTDVALLPGVLPVDDRRPASQESRRVHREGAFGNWQAMKLYDSIGPNPRVVRMALAEKSMTVEMVKVDLMGAENRKAGYLAKVPTGGLPALELDDGTVIAEITVIAEYLEDIAPFPPIIGATAAERAETRMWVRRIDLGVVEPMANGFRASQGRRMFDSRMTLVSLEAAAELKALAQEKLLWLDGQMQGRTWVCGDRFTLADMFLLAFVEFGASVGQPMPASATWLPEWHKRASSRPSATA